MTRERYDLLFAQVTQLFQLMMHGPVAAQWRERARNKKEDFREGPAHRGQGRLLTLLLEQDGLAQRDIVQELDIRPSSAGELTDKLVQAGLAERRQDEQDKRVMQVFLTDKGREEAKKASASRAELLGDFFDVLSDEEQAQLSELLGKMIAALKDKYGDVPDRRGCGPREPHPAFGPRGPHPMEGWGGTPCFDSDDESTVPNDPRHPDGGDDK